MTVERLERWMALLPRPDRTAPIMSVDGRLLSPAQILAEARAGTALGRLAQAEWETRGVGTDEELLRERIKKRLERYPADKVLFYTLGRGLTPSDIMREVRVGTKFGRDMVEAERAYLSYLNKLRERV